MLYDYFTKSASSVKTLAALSAGGAAGAGALGSELSGGDWKDNLLNATGAGVGATTGILGGAYGVVPLANILSTTGDLLADSSTKPVLDSSKRWKLLRAVVKHPFLSIGALAGLGGGLGYATTNAFTGKKRKDRTGYH